MAAAETATGMMAISGNVAAASVAAMEGGLPDGAQRPPFSDGIIAYYEACDMPVYRLHSSNVVAVDSVEGEVRRNSGVMMCFNKRLQATAAVRYMVSVLRMTEDAACARFAGMIFGDKRLTKEAIARHLREHRKLERLSPEELAAATLAHRRAGRPAALSEEDCQRIHAFIEGLQDDNVVTFADIVEFVTDKLKRKVSDDALRATLQRIGIVSVPAQPADRARCDFDISRVEEYFRDLQQINGIPAAFVVNADETGQSPWGNKRQITALVTARSNIRSKTLPVDRNGMRSTAVVGISLCGEMVQPQMIVKRATLDRELSLLGYDNVALYGQSDTAYVNTGLFWAWITRCLAPFFASHRAATGYRGPAFLILDNHASHIHASIVNQCADLGIAVLFLPAHTSHILQPCDLGIFGVQKAYYQREDPKTHGVAVTSQSKELMRVVNSLRKATTRSNVIGGFHAVGIYRELNDDGVAVARFDPSLARAAQHAIQERMDAQFRTHTGQIPEASVAPDASLEAEEELDQAPMEDELCIEDEDARPLGAPDPGYVPPPPFQVLDLPESEPQPRQDHVLRPLPSRFRLPCGADFMPEVEAHAAQAGIELLSNRGRGLRRG